MYFRNIDLDKGVSLGAIISFQVEKIEMSCALNL
jgi:hypothetical protein